MGDRKEIDNTMYALEEFMFSKMSQERPRSDSTILKLKITHVVILGSDYQKLRVCVCVCLHECVVCITLG